MLDVAAASPPGDAWASPTTGHVHVHGLADAAGIDVDVDDLGLGGEVGEIAGDAIVKPGADADEAIAFLHGVVGGRASRACRACSRARGSSSSNAPRPSRVVVQGMFPFSASLRMTADGAADDRAAADVKHRPFAAVDQFGGFLHLPGVRGHVGGLALEDVRRAGCRPPRRVQMLVVTSLGRSISTGPGRPVVATRNASLTMRGRSCTSLTR